MIRRPDDLRVSAVERLVTDAWAALPWGARVTRRARPTAAGGGVPGAARVPPGAAILSAALTLTAG
jgi:hypothetical protein